MTRAKKKIRGYTGRKILVVESDSTVNDMSNDVSLQSVCAALTSVTALEELEQWIAQRKQQLANLASKKESE